eukprot:scaffold1446_cov391-Prasinococcus_capsulatus_cf.AAC.3
MSSSSESTPSNAPYIPESPSAEHMIGCELALATNCLVNIPMDWTTAGKSRSCRLAAPRR